MRHGWLPLAALFLFVASTANAQSTPTSAQAAAFTGTWIINMTEPAAFKSTQTVRIFDRNGVVAASIQAGNSPPLDVTGILGDGDMLVLTINRAAPSAMRENGAPIWSVMTLTLDGETMTAALTLERSQTIKRGTGRRQP